MQDANERFSFVRGILTTFLEGGNELKARAVHVQVNRFSTLKLVV